MSSRLWADIGKFKVTQLRGLAGRPPYFHDGSASNVKEAIQYHVERFNIEMNGHEKRQLEAFLNAL